jgi:hypothetical protein
MGYELRDGIALTATEYGQVLLDKRTGVFWSLNETGATILEKLLEGQEQHGIASYLCARYDSDEHEVAQHVAALIKSLAEAKLITSSERAR